MAGAVHGHGRHNPRSPCPTAAGPSRCSSRHLHNPALTSTRVIDRSRAKPGSDPTWRQAQQQDLLTLTLTPLHLRDTLMVLIQGSPGVWLDYPKFSAASSGFSHNPQHPPSRFPAGRLQRHTVRVACLIYKVKFSPRAGYRDKEFRRGLKA